MKITCPKCQSSYKVDLPDPGEAGIDVQCGKCHYIFLFRTDIEKPKSASIKTGASDLPEARSSEPILPPQKDEDQEVSDSNEPSIQSQKEAASLSENDPEASQELELEPIVDDPEPIEIVVEDEGPEESLEEVALDTIWNQAVAEGSRTVAEPKEESPDSSSKKPDDETVEAPSQPEKKKLPSLEDRQREIDQMIADHQAKQKESGAASPTEEETQPPSTEKELPEDKTQEEIDLEERVVVDEGEALPNWEDAFLHQAKVEDDWKKAQEQDRILEEQQLADALGKTPSDEPVPQESAADDPAGNQQNLVDDIFTEAKSSQESQKEAAESPQPVPTEENDPEEKVITDAGETMPSWEEAFADQSEVETGWRKAQEKDRIHEEQQLADALGEKYVPPEPGDEQTPVSSAQEKGPDPVGQLFEEAQTQPQSDEPSDAKSQDKPTEVPSEQAPSSDIQESHVEEHTIPGEIDLMTDLDDLNMKQLVTEAFKEESESQEKAKRSALEPPPDDEADQELELTMESEAETPQDAEPPSLDTIPELEMESSTESTSESTEEEPELEPIPELTLESDEQEPEPIEVTAQEETETDPIPELTLESAEEETEDETAHKLESLLEAAETPEEVEAVIAEIPLEMESESEATTEIPEETEASTEQAAKAQKSLLEQEEEQIWNDLLAEHDEEEKPVEAEAPAASASEEVEELVEENDFWDQVLEKDSQESETIEPDQLTDSPAPMAPDTAEREALTDEELWKQAFPDDEEFETTPSQFSEEEQEDSSSQPVPLVIKADVTPEEGEESSEDPLKYDEAAYADYDDDDDEFEFQRRKRKLGPFTIPHGRRGDLVVGGAMVVFLLIAGSVYFTLQTFAPGELTDMQTAETEVPEGLTPREVPLDELAGDLIKPTPEKTPATEQPGDKGEAILSDPAEILKESPEEKSLLKDLAESQILKDTGKTQSAKIDESALQALTGHSVTLSTIMPVAYNPTDIRVLSFSVEMQLSDAKSAKRVRESLPVYEDILNQTVEDFLRRKFYNDILYVKEKLQKRLQTAMNQSLKNGRVRKTKFTDFAIQ